MFSDMLMSTMIVVAVVAIGLRVILLGREGLDRHLAKEHSVRVIKVSLRLLRHFCEMSLVLDDAFG